MLSIITANSTVKGLIILGHVVELTLHPCTEIDLCWKNKCGFEIHEFCGFLHLRFENPLVSVPLKWILGQWYTEELCSIYCEGGGECCTPKTDREGDKLQADVENHK